MKHFAKLIFSLGLLICIATLAYAADQAINARTELAEAPAENDILPIYDADVAAGKRVTVLNLLNALEGALTGFEIHADNLPATDAELAAIAALTFQDASVIQLTGAAAVAVLTSGGNNYILGSNSDNSALEFKTPANVLSQIGGQVSDAELTAIAGLTFQDAAIIQLTGAAAAATLASGGNNYILGSNSDNSALEFKTPANVLSQIGAQAADADLTTYAGITPSTDVQTFLGYANLAAMKAGLSVDDLVTLSGVADGSVNLGEFTGSTITDNVTIKAALQLIETAVEGLGGGHAAVTLDVDAAVLLDLSTQEIGLDTQTANYVFAGPETGVANEPTFRALVDADIPAAIARDTELPDVTAYDTAEERQDEVGAMWSSNTETGITITYQDDDGTIDAVVSISTSEVAAATLVTVAETIAANNNDTTLPTSAAVKAYADSVAGAPTNVTPVDTADEDATFYPLLVDGATGSQATETDGELTYNPSTGLLTVPTLSSGAGGFTVDADGDVVGKSFSTGTSTAPTITLSDSDNAAGTAAINANSGGGANDIILTVGVEDSTGESTPYIEVDGVTETIDLLKSVVITGDQFKLPSSNADPTATAGYLRHDSTISNFTNGGLVYYNGAAIKQIVDMTTATASACTDDQIVAYDADNDLWYCKDDSTGAGSLGSNLSSTTNDITSDNNAVQFVANSEDLVLTATANMWTFSSTTGAAITSTPALTVTGTLTASNDLSVGDDLSLTSDGAVINIGAANDVTITHSANTLTLGGGDLALGANNLTLTGSIGATGARSTKGWFTDLEVTNAIAGSVTGTAASLSGSALPTNSTVGTSIAIGADPADAGAIRLPNAGYIYSEADAAGTDISVIGVDSSEIVQIAASGASGVTITPDTTITGDLTIAGDDLNLDAAGVKLTGSNGSLTILGLGDGQDEDIKIDLNTTANTIEITSPASSATAVDFNTLNLVTTGTIQGSIKINSDSNGMTSGEMTTAGMYGSLFVATGAGTWALPAAAAGMSFCMLVPTAAAVVINPDDSDVLVYDGTADTAGHQISGGAANGDFICFIAVDTTNWHSMGRRGTWTPGS